VPNVRKLVLALYRVAVDGTVFEARRLFPGCPQPKMAARCAAKGEKPG